MLVGTFFKNDNANNPLNNRNFNFVKKVMQRTFGDGVLESVNRVAGIIYSFLQCKFIIKITMALIRGL